jgi:hypothetical protein
LFKGLQKLHLISPSVVDTLNQVNLKKGTMTVPPGESEVVHNICLAFVTATLYLLVQPRPRIVETVNMPAKYDRKRFLVENND